MHLFTMQSQCVLNRSSNQDAHYSCPRYKNTSLILPVEVFPLQLVNLHRNWRYFIIKHHTLFRLSYFLKTNINFYCIYQYLMSIKSFVNTYLFLDAAATPTRKFTQKSEIFRHITAHMVLSIDAINISNILNRKEVVKEIPPYFRKSICSYCLLQLH